MSGYFFFCTSFDIVIAFLYKEAYNGNEKRKNPWKLVKFHDQLWRSEKTVGSVGQMYHVSKESSVIYTSCSEAGTYQQNMQMAFQLGMKMTLAGHQI